jgi:hypothetical protein
VIKDIITYEARKNRPEGLATAMASNAPRRT